MPHGLERRVLGQMVAHVVGEDLVHHRRRHDRRDQHTKREQLPGRGLADPVIRLAREDLGAGIGDDVGREDRAERPARGVDRRTIAAAECQEAELDRLD